MMTTDSEVMRTFGKVPTGVRGNRSMVTVTKTAPGQRTIAEVEAGSVMEASRTVTSGTYSEKQRTVADRYPKS
jgi:hypothetical protein